MPESVICVPKSGKEDNIPSTTATSELSSNISVLKSKDNTTKQDIISTTDIEADPESDAPMMAQELEILLPPEEQREIEQDEAAVSQPPLESNRARKKRLWVAKIIKQP
ncbi:unnamed protein product [Macrosiphum euphorbiae]|uniref:Uncharacterized protein n=1 Tax=Macrosiphum euphorbiae TaxID=13131 RepID=A0AAV0XJ74_9HEMI|nr:unnamed protein product [Macrosiphum euphorbiae]